MGDVLSGMNARSLLIFFCNSLLRISLNFWTPQVLNLRDIFSSGVVFSCLLFSQMNWRLTSFTCKYLLRKDIKFNGIVCEIPQNCVGEYLTLTRNVNLCPNHKQLIIFYDTKPSVYYDLLFQMESWKGRNGSGYGRHNTPCVTQLG